MAISKDFVNKSESKPSVLLKAIQKRKEVLSTQCSRHCVSHCKGGHMKEPR